MTGPNFDTPFDGYPYLVTRIGRSALRHLAVLPAGLDREALIAIAVRQAAVNRLDIALVLGPADAVFVSPDGITRATDFIPTGIPICDRLVVAIPQLGTGDLEIRRDALRNYVRRHRVSGHIVGDNLEAGRPAAPADADRLLGTGPDGLPRGLERCRSCGTPRGEALRPLPGGGRGWPDQRFGREIVTVPCRCENTNRCAGCGQPLAEQRLSAWSWFGEQRGLLYVAAYVGLGHRCGDGAARHDSSSPPKRVGA